MKAPRVVAAVVLALLGLLVLTSCVLGGDGAADPGPSPTYDPVPDAQLFDRVARLDGVRSADLDYVDTFANPNSYGGTITVDPGAKHVERIVDQACAILRQGHPDASIVLDVALPDSSTVSTVAYDVAFPEDLEKRYGPQPGTGQVPDDAPPLTKVPGVP